MIHATDKSGEFYIFKNAHGLKNEIACQMGESFGEAVGELIEEADETTNRLISTTRSLETEVDEYYGWVVEAHNMAEELIKYVDGASRLNRDHLIKILEAIKNVCD